MTSRTTKQAARAYQKAHGVPYAEALRVVMSGTHPRHADEETWLQHAEETRANPDQTFRFQLLDPLGEGLEWSEETTPHERLAARPSVGKELRDVQATPSGPSHLRIPLGTSVVDHGFTPDGAPGELPVEWVPFQALKENRAPALRVFGPPGVGKSAFLATLAENTADHAPVLVVTSRPRDYPVPRAGLQLFFPDDQDTHPVAADVDPDLVLAAVQELAADHSRAEFPVVIYDMDDEDEGPGLHEALGRLLRVCRSKAVPVIFSETGQGANDPTSPAIGRFHAKVVLNVRADQSQAPREMTDVGSYPYNWAQMRGHAPIPLARLHGEEVMFLGR